MQIVFVTSNLAKYNQAKLDCSQFGIKIVQDASHDFTEIQSESGEEIARHKATAAFELLQKPLVISDDSWNIPGLGGFPGAYMKSINHWFTPEDWLRLTASLTDRRIILRQVVVYQDTAGQQVFIRELPGVLMKEIRGKSPYPHSTITSLDGGKTTTAMWHERGESAAQGLASPWHDFAAWYTKNHVKI
ncbi:hypothetical protein KDA06_02615 [Candidatus Saccharibacteria bacterium]|nr:hypothetical protein [Candidatus Saccharibacteria bacterium]